MINLAVKKGIFVARIAKIGFIIWANYTVKKTDAFSKAKIRHELQVCLIHLKIVLLFFF